MNQYKINGKSFTFHETVTCITSQLGRTQLTFNLQNSSDSMHNSSFFSTQLLILNTKLLICNKTTSRF